MIEPMAQETYETLGVVQQGQMRVQDRTAFERALRRFPDGLVSVTIATTTEKAQRSLAQNRYQWRIFDLIAAEAGHTKEEVHDLMCAKFLTYQVDTVDRKTGEITSVQVTKGTSRLNAAEHAYFMEQVTCWAGEFFGMTFPAREVA